MKFLGALFGLISLPAILAFVITFFKIISFDNLTWNYQCLPSAFLYGFVSYLLLHYFIHKPIVIYVFGHELSHAIWGKLFGAKISDFKFGKDGGSVKLSKSNFIIALAPYFFPIYSLFIIGIWWICIYFYPNLNAYPYVLYALIGISWAFHIVMTIESIMEGQSDITGVGALFALPFLIFINLQICATGLHILDFGFDAIKYNKISITNTYNYYTLIFNFFIQV